VPIVVTLNSLDETALMKILVEPKNSLVKQYKKLFELDGVQLDFKEDALEAIAKKSLERKNRRQRSPRNHGRYDDGSDV
jgi:clpX: ATP-dependent Clp protease, ATP-binding subunit ClpX